MVFVCLFLVSSVTLRVRRACSRGAFLNKYFVAVYVSILSLFSSFFGSVCPFRCSREFSFLLLGGAEIFAKSQSNIAKSPKIGAKVCAHHFIMFTTFYVYLLSVCVSVCVCVYGPRCLMQMNE